MNNESIKEANKIYWGKRAEQRLISSEQKALRLEKDLKKQFENVYENINTEISKLYFKYASDTGFEYEEAIKNLSKAERKDFQETLEFYIEKSNDESYIKEYKNYLKGLSTKARISRLETLKANIKYEVNTLYSKYFQENTQITLDDILKDTYYKTIYDIQSLVGYSSSFNRISPNTINALLEYPWSGKNYSKKIWGHIDKFENKLEDVLTAGIVQGKSNQSMAAELKKATDTEYKNAIRLVRTETNYITNKATEKAYGEFNVEKYMYLAALDLRTSDICRELDSKIYDVKDAKAGLNYPPMHPHCRSTTIPYFEDLEQYDEVKSMSYNDWYEKNVANNSEMLKNEQILKNKSSDETQYKKYKNILGNEAPKTFKDFQELKYNASDKYDILKKNYRDKNRELKKQQKGLSSSNKNNNQTAPKFIEKINVKDNNVVSEKLSEYEKAILDEKVENAYVILKNGKVYKFTGDESSVNPSILGKNVLEGSIITHNHPIGESEYSFSREDINFFEEYKLDVLRGIDEKYTYELNRNGICNYENISIFDIDEYSYQHYKCIEKAKEGKYNYVRTETNKK